jgi:hypothetical protein
VASPDLSFDGRLASGGAPEVVLAADSAMVIVVVGSLVRIPLPPWARLAIVGLALCAVLLRELHVVTFTLPENRRLVPETVLRLGRHLGPLQFGLEMGTGVRTYLPSGLPYVAALAVLLVAPVPAAACVGAGFGIGRALMTTANVRYGQDGSWNDEWLAHQRMLAWTLGSAFAFSLLVACVTALW